MRRRGILESSRSSSRCHLQPLVPVINPLRYFMMRHSLCLQASAAHPTPALCCMTRPRALRCVAFVAALTGPGTCTRCDVRVTPRQEAQGHAVNPETEEHILEKKYAD